MTSKTLDSLARLTRVIPFKLLSPPTTFAVFLALLRFHALAFIPFEYFYNLLKKLFSSPNRMRILLKRRNVSFLLLTDFSLEPVSSFCYQFSSVTHSYLTLCDPMNHSMPGLPVHHQLPGSLKFMSVESVMPSSHLILCHPLLLLPSIPPSIRVFSNESTLRMRWPSTGVSALTSFLPKKSQG